MMMLGDLPGVQDMAAQANAEEPAEILPEVIRRLGKDEMNLAEFPITLLTDRAPKGQSIIRYQDQIFDTRLTRLLTRKLTVTAPEEYGLPTALDDDILLALIQITKNTNGFSRREVRTITPPRRDSRAGRIGSGRPGTASSDGARPTSNAAGRRRRTPASGPRTRRSIATGPR
jgi:hypothetical protein